MGVPAFFRWLERQCVDITNYCVEGGVSTDPETGRKIYKDTSTPNPNNIEFDNLYLDMNGIIHPCSHPEDRPAPRNEDEIMVCIFDSIDRLFNICRPRKVLYMAIDGVAPRAKMNQQRSRRFRAAKESIILRETKEALAKELLSRGCRLPEKDPKKMRFDSNCITPGTSFMEKLANCLRFYIYDKFTNDPGWRDIKVILSDASVPGEGEHKIMDYIRKQRSLTSHDPNTRHIICGADADLIMLGLATHEPNFTIIRDEFVPGKPSPCGICGKMEHSMEDCTGLAPDENGPGEVVFQETKFIFIHIKIIREWLELEMKVEITDMKYDLENIIDDWILLCFFVGNDFLPHLPSLEIRESAINKLVKIYKDCLQINKSYMTKNGTFDVKKVEYVMQQIGVQEDEIFRERHRRETNYRNRSKRMRREKELKEEAIKRHGQSNVVAIGEAHNGQWENTNVDESKSFSTPVADKIREKKKKADTEMPNDSVMLHQAGWRERYYQSKFNVSSKDEEFKAALVRSYTEGLAWVLAYYFQGCVSWEWYFPYHYAPFASDFKNLDKISIEWPISTPRAPLEQLMCVFPAASKEFLPVSWQKLMCEPTSPIIDFYPIDFKLDLNGKKFEWMGVALLPFVDEARLKRTLKKVYPNLNENEKYRNTRGENLLFVSKHNPLATSFENKLKSVDKVDGKYFPIDLKFSKGLSGMFSLDERMPLNPENGYDCPIPNEMDGIKKLTAFSVRYKDPNFPQGHIFIPKLLPGAILPPKVGLTCKTTSQGNLYSKPSEYKPNRFGDSSKIQSRMIQHGTGQYKNNSQYGINNSNRGGHFQVNTGYKPSGQNVNNYNGNNQRGGGQNRGYSHNNGYNNRSYNNMQQNNYIPLAPMNQYAQQFFIPQSQNVPTYTSFNVNYGVHNNRGNSRGNSRGGRGRGRGRGQKRRGS